jgi:hypothetical protein
MSDFIKDMFIEVREKGKDTVDATDMLMEMIGETLDAVYEEFAIGKQQLQEEEKSPTLKGAKVSAEEFMLVLPKFVPTEAWGKPESMEREQINRLFSVIGGGRTVKGKLDFLKRITVPDNKITSPRRIISSLIILESLKAVIYSFNASSAGFVFEGWLAALLQGVQEDEISAKGNLPIQDLIAFSSHEDKALPISLKLLNQTTKIEGSYTNLVDGLDEFGKMIYIVARKGGEGKNPDSIAIEEFTLDQENFIDALLLAASGQAKATGKKLFMLPGKTFEESYAALKAETSWPDKYALLQITSGYSARIRKKRAAETAKTAAEAAEKEAADAAQDPSSDTDLEGNPLNEPTLNEMIIEEWKMLNEDKKGGTQWHISAPQLASFNFVKYKTLGVLPVSEAQILDVAKMYMDRLNGQLYGLFKATQLLSENINKYFTNDNRNRALGQGDRAINNTKTIQASMAGVMKADTGAKIPEEENID